MTTLVVALALTFAVRDLMKGKESYKILFRSEKSRSKKNHKTYYWLSTIINKECSSILMVRVCCYYSVENRGADAFDDLSLVAP